MSTLAKVVPIPKGNYSASATYNSLDIVRYDGKSWMCKQDSITNITPTEGAYWMMIVQDGGGATSLSSLSDVTVNSPSNGQILLYNSTSGKWENNVISPIIFGDVIEGGSSDSGTSESGSAGDIIHVYSRNYLIALTDAPPESVSSFAKIYGHTYSQAEQEFLLNYYFTPQSGEVNCSSLTAIGVPQRYDTGTYIYYGIPVLDMKIRESNGSASYKKSNLQINFYCKIWNL